MHSWKWPSMRECNADTDAHMNASQESIVMTESQSFDDVYRDALWPSMGLVAAAKARCLLPFWERLAW